MIGFFKKALIFLVVACVIGGIAYAVKITVIDVKPSMPTNLGKVERKDLIQRISFAGIIASKRRSIITAPYSGYIKDLFVCVGTKVKKGDPLVSITASLDNLEEVHPLRAPFSGLVTLVRKEEGEFIKEADTQDFVLRIDDLSRYFVEAKVPEIDRTKVAIGQEALIKASALSQTPLKGVVKRVSIAPEEKGGGGYSFGGKVQVEYSVFIELTDVDDRIKPGMSAIIDVTAASRKAVLTLSHEYVQIEADRTFVTLKNGEKREINVGLKNDEAVEILDGLNEGDEIQQVEFAP